MKTQIFHHGSDRFTPFKLDTWSEIHHITELDNHRILASVVHKDFFIVADDEHHFWMFDVYGYKLIDKGYVRNHRVTSMLILSETKAVFGH